MTQLAVVSQPDLPSSQRFLRRALHKPLGVISAVYLVLLTLACVLAPLIAPYGPLAEDLTHVQEGPSAAHLLGTDELGRDVLSRLLYGGRLTLLGVVECVGVLLIISLPVGLAAGYLGGHVDRAASAVVDLLLSVPAIIVVLAVLAVFGSSMAAAMVTFGVLGSAGVIRVVRSAVLSVREELYVAAARVSGVSEPRIVIRHVLPRIAGPVIVQASLFAAIALAIQTGLAFLSLGVAPPAPSWGGMVGEAASLIDQDGWLLVPSGGIIALTILAFGLIGDAVRDATVEGWSSRTAPALRAGRRARPEAAPDDRPESVPAGPAAGAAAPADAVLAVQDLTIEFDGPGGPVTVVDHVSFALRPGEVLGIVGESGCGKSVTALSLLQLLPSNGRIRGGRVLLGGRDLTAMTERQISGLRGSAMAMVFQEPTVSLDPSFLVGSQVAEVVRRHDRVSRAAARQRVLELFEQVRLPDPGSVARRYPHELSGGMAQRVSLALALAGRPGVLIADEPTTALDVTVQAEILELLRQLRAETGMSIILVTHDWGVVADICDRAVVMYAGQIVEQARIGALFREPHHPYTLGLQECNPQLWGSGDDLPVIPGTVLPPALWPASCRFRERCRFATAECAQAPVPLERDADDREVRCIHWQQVAPVRSA
ncbi:MAG: dipeptide/oligopeptide/nickel ABC transporter permease/ATP-binding protein [Streptosporangiaceae bacterium]